MARASNRAWHRPAPPGAVREQQLTRFKIKESFAMRAISVTPRELGRVVGASPIDSNNDEKLVPHCRRCSDTVGTCRPDGALFHPTGGFRCSIRISKETTM